jgi:UDP-N-acetylglucosamine acyltransferase
MIQIHPTAVVEPSAELGARVTIGPYCVIGRGVILGDGCRLHHHVSLAGPAKIGADNEFYPFSCIGHRTQDLKYRGEPTHLEIGDGNTFREFTTAHRGTDPGSVTRIGTGGNFLAYSHIAHDCVVGDKVIFSNNGTLAGHVEVGDHAIIGGLTAVHQFCRIGSHAITGGCSKIVQDVPPFMIADGNPAEVRSINRVGLERREFSQETIRLIREAFRLIYRSGFNLKQAVEAIRERLDQTDEIRTIVEFVESSQRGIIR